MSLEVDASAFGEPDDNPIEWGSTWADEMAEGSDRTRIGTALVRSQLSHLPHPEPLVAGVISTPAAVVVIGPYGAGKTALVDGIACSIATGLPWLGRPVRRARVLIVIGEGAYGKEARLAAWEQCWNSGRQISDDDMTVLVKPATLTNLLTWSEIRSYATDGGYGFVVLDTFSSLAPDADETKDSALIMRQLSDLSAAINGTALLVHHPGWSDASRARGGYQLEANADEVLLLTGNPQDQLVCLARKKVKDGPAGATIWLRRKSCFGSIVMESARPDEIEAPVRDRLLLILDACGPVGSTGRQLMNELGIEDKGRSGFYKALGKAIDDNAITQAGERNARRYYLPNRAPKDKK